MKACPRASLGSSSAHHKPELMPLHLGAIPVQRASWIRLMPILPWSASHAGPQPPPPRLHTGRSGDVSEFDVVQAFALSRRIRHGSAVRGRSVCRSCGGTKRDHPMLASWAASVRELEPVVRQKVVIAALVLLSADTPDRIRTCLHGPCCSCARSPWPVVATTTWSSRLWPSATSCESCDAREAASPPHPWPHVLGPVGDRLAPVAVGSGPRPPRDRRPMASHLAPSTVGSAHLSALVSMDFFTVSTLTAGCSSCSS